MQKIIVFSLGFFSMAAQAIVFREFISTFDSGGLTVAIFLFSWLFWISLSSFVTSRIKSLQDFAAKLSPGIFLLYIPAFCLQFFLIFRFRKILGIASYAEIAPATVIICSLAMNFPLSMLTAIFFQSSATWLKTTSDFSSAAAHRFEALGSFAGGTVSSVLFFSGANSILLGIISSLFLSFSCATVYHGAKKRAAMILPAFLFVILIFRTDRQISDFLSREKWGRFLPAESFQEAFNTEQGGYLAGRYYGQAIFAKDSGICETVPDDESNLANLSIAFSQKPRPKNIIIAGGGLSLPLSFAATGKNCKIFSFPDDREYVLRAATFLKKERHKLPPNIEFPDNDIRNFISNPDNAGFDLIFINISGFASLQAGRFCSRQFFNLIKKSISADGILVIVLPSSENYLGDETAFIGASIHKTLSASFKHILIYQGESMAFAASNSKLSENVKEMENNIASISGSAILLPELMRNLYNAERGDFARLSFGKLEKKISIPLNTDEEPALFFPSLLIFSKKSSLNLSLLLKVFELRKFVFLLPLTICLALLVAIVSKLIRGNNSRYGFLRGVIMVFSAGFAGMTSAISLTILLQTALGSIYLYFGLVTSTFMFGVFAGNIFYVKLRNPFFKNTCVGPILLLSTNIILISFISFSAGNILSIFSFAFLFFAAGFLNGAIFVSAFEHAALEKNEEQARLASPFLCADNLGAASASILAGLLIIPVSGVGNALFSAIILIFANMLLLASAPIHKK